MKYKRWLYVVGGLALGTAFFFWLRPGRSVFEVSKGYEGPVVVFYEHPDGVDTPWNWGDHLYRIPQSGVLLVKNPRPARFQITEWLYVDNQGASTEIPLEDDSHPDYTIEYPVVRQQRFTSGDHYSHTEAQIGRPSDIDSFGTPPHFLVDDIIDRLSKRR